QDLILEILFFYEPLLQQTHMLMLNVLVLLLLIFLLLYFHSVKQDVLGFEKMIQVLLSIVLLNLKRILEFFLLHSLFSFYYLYYLHSLIGLIILQNLSNILFQYPMFHLLMLLLIPLV